MATHQAAQFSSNLNVLNETAVKIIGKFLLGTIDEGLMCRLGGAHIHRFFSVRHDKHNTEYPPSAHSRTMFVTKHAVFSVIWKSKLQMEMSLSTTSKRKDANNACDKINKCRDGCAKLQQQDEMNCI